MVELSESPFPGKPRHPPSRFPLALVLWLAANAFVIPWTIWPHVIPASGPRVVATFLAPSFVPYAAIAGATNPVVYMLYVGSAASYQYTALQEALPPGQR